jgi:hypothetical protein
VADFFASGRNDVALFEVSRDGGRERLTLHPVS